jgi:hypothetical protein
MEAIEQVPLGDDVTAVVFAKNQPQYTPLPALVYPDGKILIEWSFTEQEREQIARGENLRHWIFKPPLTTCPHCAQSFPTLLQPLALEVTDERIA